MPKDEPQSTDIHPQAATVSEESLHTTVPPYTETALAIVGPHGNIWTNRLYQTPEAARAYLEAFWGPGKWEPAKWSVVPATLTVAAEPINGPIELTPLVETEHA